jgi:hypothetical protein
LRPSVASRTVAAMADGLSARIGRIERRLYDRLAGHAGTVCLWGDPTLAEIARAERRAGPLGTVYVFAWLPPPTSVPCGSLEGTLRAPAIASAPTSPEAAVGPLNAPEEPLDGAEAHA